jgi:2-polyprenyl-3-methyl-5-hydroxy-6-metoxy-1,4-benzoquinol methylase
VSQDGGDLSGLGGGEVPGTADGLGKLMNINTVQYWNGVYRDECESGRADSGEYSRDYGPVHDAIVGLVPEGSRVLDVACGPGLLCRKVKQRVAGVEVTGVDFSDYMVCRNQERDRGLGVEYRCLDVRGGLASLGGPYDVVMMCEVLEHLEEPEFVVGSAMGLLRLGGLFILSCPHDEGIPDPEHLRTWGHDEVFHLLAAYGETVSFRHFPPPYFHVWMLAYMRKGLGWGDAGRGG